MIDSMSRIFIMIQVQNSLYFKKENDRIDTFSKRRDYIIIKEIFDHNILKINNNEIVSVNHHQINIMLYIIKSAAETVFYKQRKTLNIR